MPLRNSKGQQMKIVKWKVTPIKSSDLEQKLNELQAAGHKVQYVFPSTNILSAYDVISSYSVEEKPTV
jgi:hypothetical protein